ncbi:MAG TPA: hypothetical protein VG273_04315 [Bryobacteraceae bacterium]|nr:hypothetical protein [Bryobacteraceae bacterium]
MTVIVPHGKTRAQAIATVDHAVDELYKTSIGGVEIVNPVKTWNESAMTFSFTGKMGFIEVPLSGTAAVDDRDVTIVCELPIMLKNFIGEDRIRAGVESKIRGFLSR